MTLALSSDHHPVFKFTGDLSQYPAEPTRCARRMEELGARKIFASINGGGKEGHWGGGMVDHREVASWLGRESWWQNQGMEPGLVLTVPYASPWSSGAAYSRLSSLLGTFVNHAKSSNLTN